MTNYYTNFACVLNVGTPENAARALDLYANGPEDEDWGAWPDGFHLMVSQSSPSDLWIDSRETGDIEQLIGFVMMCAQELEVAPEIRTRY